MYKTAATKYKHHKVDTFLVNHCVVACVFYGCRFYIFILDILILYIRDSCICNKYNFVFVSP
jgi:hypothetical protein